jgi:hypothetical protein
MKRLIDQVDKDKLYLEVDRYEGLKDIHLKLIRQYDEQDPEIKFEAFLSDEALDNIIIELQKVSLFNGKKIPDPDNSKNFGKH